MKKTIPLIVILAFLIFSPTPSLEGLYQDSTSVVIHEDGNVTPLSAPIVRDGEKYTLNDDIHIPATTNEGIIIERNGITLDGAGHTIKGHEQSSAIYLENLNSVIIKNVMLTNFYYGIEFNTCTGCTVYNSNLTAVMYPLYLKNSSDNLIYHNNIYRIPYYSASDNSWDNGYPEGGNYWDGYPYPDLKSGLDQNLPGSDGIGDVKVGEEIFSNGGENVDNYPIFKEITFFEELGTSLKVTVKDSTGKAVSGASIQSNTQPLGQSTLSGTSGSDGSATFSVKPGPFTLQANKDGYATAKLFLNVEGDTAEATLTLFKGTPEWLIQTVDFEEVGKTNSLALDSKGNPYISYFDFQKKQLKFAKWTGLNWEIEVLDTGDLGDYSSIAVNPEDNPTITYCDYLNDDLKYAMLSKSGWKTAIIDSGGTVGYYTSLVLESGYSPRISYYDYSKLDLKYAIYDGAKWVTETVDSTGDVGKYSSVALTRGNPVISYFDETNKDLKLATYTGTQWSIQVVDSEGHVGAFSSLKLDSEGNPCISYYDSTNGDLKYAEWTGSTWNIQKVDTTGNTGYYTSLALDSEDKPYISYTDYTNYNLMLATWDGTHWKTQVVDQDGRVGEYTSLALTPDDVPCISYYYASKLDLKYATLMSSKTQPSIKITVVNAQSQPIQGVSIISVTQPAGQSALSGSTDTQGVTTFNDIQPGTYSIVASKTGYQNTPTQLTAAIGKTTEITLTLQAAVANAQIKITVKDKSGAAVSGVNVVSIEQPSGQTALSGTTGTNGEVTFGQILPGSYKIQASKSGYLSSSKQLEAIQTGTISATITLEPQQTGGGDEGGGSSSGGIPGYPVEAILIGVLLVVLLVPIKRSQP